MDKEAQEKIIASVLLEETMRSEVAADMVALKIRQRLEAHGFGCLKLPEGKPPLLSWERIRMVLQGQNKRNVTDNMFRLEAIAQAQRDSDIKWYEEQ